MALGLLSHQVGMTATATAPEIPATTTMFTEEWKSVVLDPDAPELVGAMVEAARSKLAQDDNYEALCASLARLPAGKNITNNNKARKNIRGKIKGAFKQKNKGSAETAEANDPSYIEDWIEELLRFLALRVLIVGEELVPSRCVRDAWRELLYFPVTYADICMAMGGSATVKFDHISSGSDGHDEPTSSLVLTLESYEILFGEVAPDRFWASSDGGREGRQDVDLTAVPADPAGEYSRDDSFRVTCDDVAEAPTPSSPLANEWLEVARSPEAPMLVAAMVDAAGSRLRNDDRYASYRCELARMLEEEEHLTALLPWHVSTESASSLAASVSSSIDDWIDELLRFLAMKVLIVAGPVPSRCVQDAWQALMLLPTTYGDVCEALGSAAVLEFYKGSADDESMRYALTLESYELLFLGAAPARFWPANTGKGTEEEKKKVTIAAPKAVPNRSINDPTKIDSRKKETPHARVSSTDKNTQGRKKVDLTPRAVPARSRRFDEPSKIHQGAREAEPARFRHADNGMEEEEKVDFTPRRVVSARTRRSDEFNRNCDSVTEASSVGDGASVDESSRQITRNTSFTNEDDYPEDVDLSTEIFAAIELVCCAVGQLRQPSCESNPCHPIRSRRTSSQRRG